MSTKIKGAPRSKRQGANNSPARQRYWASKRMESRKIKNLMRCCKMTRAEATALWQSIRKTRIKTYQSLSSILGNAA